MNIRNRFINLKKRFDAFVDPYTTRGSSSDKTVRTRGHGTQKSNQEYLNYYIDNGFIRNIVDDPADDATREWIKIKTNIDGEDEETDEEKDLSRLIEQRLEDIELQGKIKDLIRYSRMYPKGSFLYYGIIGENVQNKETLSKPLPERIQSIDFINVIDNPDRVNIIVENKTDPTVKTYNQPKFSIAGYEIHPTRLSWLVNSFIPSETTGISVIHTILDAAKAQDSGLWSVNSLLHQMALKIFKSDEIAGLSAEQKGELLAKIKHLMDTQSVMSLMQDEDFTQLVFNVTGIKEVFDFIFDNLAGYSKIPKRVLLGQAHGIVTGGEYDTLNYYSMIAKFNENQVRPILKKNIDLVVKEERGEVYKFINNRDIDIDFEFNSLWELDPGTESEVNLRNSQRDEIDYNVGKVNSAELRNLDDRYKGLEPFEMDRTQMNPNDLELSEEFKTVPPKKVEEPKTDEKDKKKENQITVIPIQVDIDNTKIDENKEKVTIKKNIKFTTDSEGILNGGTIEEVHEN